MVGGAGTSVVTGDRWWWYKFLRSDALVENTVDGSAPYGLRRFMFPDHDFRKKIPLKEPLSRNAQAAILDGVFERDLPSISIRVCGNAVNAAVK